MWYRVFGSNDLEVQPAALQDELRSRGWDVPFHVRGDDLGWTAIEVQLADTPPLILERYLTDVDEIRDDLDTWAAWVETRARESNAVRLMQQLIGTKQLITFRRLSDHPDPICETVVRFLAKHTDGVYQIDGRGFRSTDGAELLPE